VTGCAIVLPHFSLKPRRKTANVSFFSHQQSALNVTAKDVPQRDVLNASTTWLLELSNASANLVFLSWIKKRPFVRV